MRIFNEQNGTSANWATQPGQNCIFNETFSESQAEYHTDKDYKFIKESEFL